jgi:hypothetical protein
MPRAVEGSTAPATPELATMASVINTVLRGQVIVKTKIFSLRTGRFRQSDSGLTDDDEAATVAKTLASCS